jgi:hypothetical protein
MALKRALLVMVGVIGLATTPSVSAAECPWVIWARTLIISTTEKPEGDVSPVGTGDTREQCEAGIAMLADLKAKQAAEPPWQVTRTQTGHTAVLRQAERTIRIQVTHECWPATVDPRARP